MVIENGYAEALAAFRVRHGLGQGDVVRTYHAVRDLPYRSGADRTPETALLNRQGACTAKHLILRDLLREQGVEAVVELVEGDFTAGLSPTQDMPPALAKMVSEGGVRDMHCRVRIGSDSEALRLDATWPDAMATHGVIVNSGWDGTGDTIGAIPNVVVRSDAEDVLTEKARLLDDLTPEQTDRRRRFLSLLSGWLARTA